ncbi:unnamed protein product [Brassica rapa]|uniref:Uncharacterized protein n=1 Tax=Brassica campestris TaxID=3711 RepID=A0A3P5ZHR9_BRACM|nr:unnamed protein product [Brassica rapa]VDC80146.1 unnamed protein product [Brassica rapa]
MKTFMNFQGCVVPKEDLDVYDNHADMSSDDTTCASSALEDEELMMESVSSSNIMFQSKDSLSLSVQSLTLEVAEPSSEVARHALINGDNDGNKQADTYTAIDKNCMVDHSSNLVKTQVRVLKCFLIVRVNMYLSLIMMLRQTQRIILMMKPIALQ